MNIMIKHHVYLTLFTCLYSLGILAGSEPKFNLGSAVSEQDIAAWDIDVRPDGEGLPPGKGRVKEGMKVYQQQCQVCHGENGQGGPNDPLVGRLDKDIFPFAEKGAPGKTLGNYWPWATTIFDYIRRTMPYMTPGSLSDNEVYAVTAYLLYANGIIPKDMTLDATNLSEIKMPAQHRFVPDNRTETNAVR